MDMLVERQRSSPALMRTGCIPCLRAGRRCDPSNPDCRVTTVSDTQWPTNWRPPAMPKYGSWRERYGAHVFLQRYTGAATVTGVFRSDFWQRTVPTACLQNDVVFHMCSAIGTLLLERPGPDRVRSEWDALELSDMALMQCNRALHLLFATPSTRNLDASEIALIVCILMTHFEGLRGNREAAMQHGLYAPKLLRAFDQAFDQSGGFSSFVDKETAGLVVRSIKTQAYYLSDFDGLRRVGLDPAEDTVSDSPFLLPNIPPFQDLDSAHSILYSAYLSLIMATHVFDDDNLTPLELECVWACRRDTFLPWIAQWQSTFEEMLIRLDDALSPYELRKADILRVVLRLMTVYARIDMTTKDRKLMWGPYGADFDYIVRVSASVLTVCRGDLYRVREGGRFPFYAHGLSVTQALFCTMARCPDYETRKRAAQLLLAQRETESSLPEWDRPSSSSKSASPITRPTWGLKRWMDIAEELSLERGALVFFGGGTHTADPEDGSLLSFESGNLDESEQHLSPPISVF